MSYSDKLKQLLKDVIDLATELTVRMRTDLLNQYDESLKKIKKTMDEAILAIKSSSQFNINEIIENLLGYMKKGNDAVKSIYIKELNFHMYKVWSKRLDVSMNMDSFKVFQKYIETRNNLNLDNLVPTVQFNHKTMIEKIMMSINTAYSQEIKFKQNLDTLSIIDDKEKIVKTLVPDAEGKGKKESADIKTEKFKESTKKRSITEDGMIVMNLSLPKSIVNNKRSSRSLTRRSTNLSQIGGLGNKDKKESDSRNSAELADSLSGIFNLPFMIPAALPEKTEGIGSNEIKVILQIGPNESKESQIPLDNFFSILTNDQTDSLSLGRRRQVELNRTNDPLQIRESIFLGLFPSVPFKKRYSVKLNLAGS